MRLHSIDFIHSTCVTLRWRENHRIDDRCLRKVSYFILDFFFILSSWLISLFGMCVHQSSNRQPNQMYTFASCLRLCVWSCCTGKSTPFATFPNRSFCSFFIHVFVASHAVRYVQWTWNHIVKCPCCTEQIKNRTWNVSSEAAKRRNDDVSQSTKMAMPFNHLTSMCCKRLRLPRKKHLICSFQPNSFILLPLIIKMASLLSYPSLAPIVIIIAVDVIVAAFAVMHEHKRARERGREGNGGAVVEFTDLWLCQMGLNEFCRCCCW